MIDLKKEIAKQIFNQNLGLSLNEIESLIEIPSDSKLGDYAFPCFALAKIMKKSPVVIAEEMKSEIEIGGYIDKIENIGGYVNLFIKKEKLAKEVVNEIITDKEKYGKSDFGKGRTVIVEYSSTNIAKPFHIGHIRSTVIGNAIYKLYEEIGFKVIRINHLGDYGTQFGKMIVAYRLWGNEEKLKENPIKELLAYYTKFHEEADKKPGLLDEARETFLKLESGSKEEVELWKKFRELSLKEFNRVYDMLGIKFDSYNGESFYSDKMQRFIDELKEKNLLIKSEGAQIVDLGENMAPAMITKSDGSSLYITRDIAAAVYRKETYDFYKCIYVVASQQNLHFEQWKKVLKLMGYEWEKDCIHVPFGLVSLEDGTMSTRNGRIVFLEDVLNESINKTKEIIKKKNPTELNIDDVAKKVGIGAVIFQELFNNRIKDYVFSWDKVLNFDGETGPYVQYTHARAASILRKSEVVVEKLSVKQIDYSYLTSESAYDLIKLLYRVPEVIFSAGEKYEPSILTRFVVDISQSFNKFYHDEHILVENDKERESKLLLVASAKQVIKNCLNILGIDAPERM